MVDLKKSSAGTDELQTEIRALTVTNQKLQGEIQTVSEQLREINSDVHQANYKFNSDIDILNYKVDTLNADMRELRREIYELDRTIYKMRESVLDAIRDSKKSELSDFFHSLFPLVAMGLPVFAMLIAVVARIMKG